MKKKLKHFGVWIICIVFLFSGMGNSLSALAEEMQPDEAICNCESIDGTHAEACPLYEEAADDEGNDKKADSETVGGEAEKKSCTCGSINGAHAEDCPLYEAAGDGEENAEDEEKDGEIGDPECSCGSADGVHAEDCPLYEAAADGEDGEENAEDEIKDEEIGDPECSCGSADGVHAEDCPLYEAAADDEENAEDEIKDEETGDLECSCGSEDGVHEEECPLYQRNSRRMVPQTDVSYEIRPGLKPIGQPGLDYDLLEGAEVSHTEDEAGNQIRLRVSDVQSSEAEWEWDKSLIIHPEKSGIVFTIRYQAYVAPEGEDEKILAELDFVLTISDEASIGDRLDGDYAYISSAVMKEDLNTESGYAISTGTEPWDLDETAGDPGVDQTPNDNIVRSFDLVSYTVEISNRVRENSLHPFYRSGTLYFELILPCEKDKAIFEESSMGWLQSKKEVVYAIDEENYTYNGQKCQVLKGSFLWEPSGDNPAAIGAGMLELNIAVRILAMQNNDTMKPLFTFWMEGNEVPQSGLITGNDAVCSRHGENEYRTVEGVEVTVTAAPRYNVALRAGAGTNSQKFGTFDFGLGNEDAPNRDAGMVEGRMVSFGIVLQMVGKSTQHGLRGLEIPEGDITFDINLSSSYTAAGKERNTTISYPTLLWSLDGNEITRECGNGRTVYAANTLCEYMPYNKLTNSGYAYKSCYDGGTWTGTQEGNIVHVKVSGYQVNLASLPNTFHSGNQDTATFYNPASVGKDYWKIRYACFSAGECWVVQPFSYGGKSAVAEYGSGFFTTVLNDVNLEAVSCTGQRLPAPENAGNDNQANQKDDRVSSSLNVEMGMGTVGQDIMYSKLDVAYWRGPLTDGCDENGKDWITPGSRLAIREGFSMSNAEDVQNGAAFDLLIKFDDRFFEPDANQNWAGPASSSVKGRFLFGAKKNGAGWEHQGLQPGDDGYDTEMKAAVADDLIFFSTLSELQSNGYVCVAVLREWRGAASANILNAAWVKGTCKTDAELVGNVFMVSHTGRGWRMADLTEAAAVYLDKDPAELTRSDYMNYAQNAFPTRGDGKEHSYEEYPAGFWINEPDTNPDLLSYQKSVYDQSGWVSGSSGTKYGDSCRVISAVTEISQKCAQINATGAEKLAYDMDTGQRIADFVLYPSLVRTDTAGEAGGSDIRTNVYVECELPVGLKLIPNSSVIGGNYVQTGEGKQGSVTGGTSAEPEVTVGDDGKMLLRWVLKNQAASWKQSRTELLPIYFSCDIGNPGGENDVENNEQLKVQSKIWSDLDSSRGFNAAFNNIAVSSILVTNNSAFSMSKVADQNVVNVGDGIGFTLNIGNDGKNPLSVIALDSLPYSGDGAGSRFDGKCLVSSFRVINPALCSAFKFYYTLNENERDKDGSEYTEEDFEDGEVWRELRIDSVSGEAELSGEFAPVSVAVVGTLPGAQTLQMHITLELPDGQPGDYIANRLTRGTMESYACTYVANRVLEGKTWLDTNKDGLQGPQEEKISGVFVTLMKLKEGGNSASREDYEPVKDAQGQDIRISTGTKMNVRSGDVSAYETGCYQFANLQPGIYGVLFSKDDGPLNGASWADYSAADVGQGTDDTVDSDALPSYSEDGSLIDAFEAGIVMPENDKIVTTIYRSSNHDLGLYLSSYDLTLEKKVTGAMGDRNKEFLFEISLKDGEGEAVNGSYSCVGQPARTIEFQNGLAQVTLKHGQSLTIKGLCRHSSYEIREQEAEKEGYQISWSQDEDRVCKDLKENKKVLCTNTRETIPPTGIRMDIWPWLLCVMGAAVAAAAWFLVPKKRKGQKKRRKGYKKLVLLLFPGLFLLTGQESFAAQADSSEVFIELSVENEVKGDVPSEAETFTFWLTPEQSGTPMPDNGQNFAAVLGTGSAGFGKLKYIEPGNYTYILSEEKGTDRRYIYDERVYFITVQVTTDDDGALHAGVFLEEEDKPGKAVKAVFTNFYKNPESVDGKEALESSDNQRTQGPAEKSAASSAPGIWGGSISTGDDALRRILGNVILFMAALGVLFAAGKRRNHPKG